MLTMFILISQTNPIDQLLENPASPRHEPSGRIKTNDIENYNRGANKTISSWKENICWIRIFVVKPTIICHVDALEISISKRL